VTQKWPLVSHFSQSWWVPASKKNESTAFPESAGGNLVTKPFPNVFEEPLKNLQT
jgi:hypothetical protein